MNSENNLTLHQGLMLIFQSSRPGTFHLSIRNLDMPTVYPDVLWLYIPDWNDWIHACSMVARACRKKSRSSGMYRRHIKHILIPYRCNQMCTDIDKLENPMLQFTWHFRFLLHKAVLFMFKLPKLAAEWGCSLTTNRSFLEMSCGIWLVLEPVHCISTCKNREYASETTLLTTIYIRMTRVLTWNTQSRRHGALHFINLIRKPKSKPKAVPNNNVVADDIVVF